jgi:molybdopterin molybdotransferase
VRLTARPAPISADEARARLLAVARPLAPVRVSLNRSCGLVLAEDLRALSDNPPFTNSARDGFAVRAADLASVPAGLPCQEEVPAGAVPAPLAPGRCAKVMTGAPLPEGADAVVMREETDETDLARVLFHRSPAAGEWVRRAGEDVRRGDPLLARGTRLRPWELALLAGQGFEAVPVFPAPRVAVLVTGGEVLRPGEPARPAAVHDANGPALSAALRRAGAEVLFSAHVPDDAKLLSYRASRALAQADVLAVSGGVSAGDKDHTRAVLESLGVEILFHGVAVRPGGPFLAGRAGDKWVFGLPGNPLSALLSLQEFALPVLSALQGLPPAPSMPLRGVLAEGFRKPAGLRQLLFCRSEKTDGKTALHPLPQGSSATGAAARADALAALPEGRDAFEAGEEVSFRWLD